MEQSVQEPQGPEMGAVARIANVFFAPAKTFESIARKPGWIVPAVLLVAITIGGGYLVLPKLDVDAIVEQRIEAAEEQGQTLTEQQQEQMATVIGMMMKFQPLLGGVFLIIALLVVPSLYHAIAAAFGKSVNWVGVFSAYAHVQMIGLLKGILILLVMMTRATIDPQRIPFLVKSNVGSFLDPKTTGKFAMAFLANVDVFEIWAIVVGSIALSKVTRLSKGMAAGVVVGLWLIWVLGTSGLATLGG